VYMAGTMLPSLYFLLVNLGILTLTRTRIALPSSPCLTDSNAPKMAKKRQTSESPLSVCIAPGKREDTQVDEKEVQALESVRQGELGNAMRVQVVHQVGVALMIPLEVV
jgi:hypothetical protein